MWECLRMTWTRSKHVGMFVDCMWKCTFWYSASVGVICLIVHYCTDMNTDETSNCHEVCPVFNWYNKQGPPHATRTFNKIFQDKNYFRSHYTVKCSSLVPLKYHHISTNPPPRHNNALFPGWQAFKNSVVIWSCLLHYQPCINSNFHFPVSVQSTTPNCRLSRSANNGPSGQGQERRVDAWFHASAAQQMRTGLFWVITQRVVVISYRRFGTTVGLYRNVGRKLPLLAA